MPINNSQHRKFLQELKKNYRNVYNKYRNDKVLWDQWETKINKSGQVALNKFKTLLEEESTKKKNASISNNNNESEKLVWLDNLWNEVEEDHLKILKQRKKEEFDKKMDSLFHSKGKKDGKRKKSEGSDSDLKFLVSVWLKSKDEQILSYLEEKKIDTKELEKILPLREEITELESIEKKMKESKLNTDDKIKFIKSVLKDILKFDNKNEELKAKLEKLENLEELELDDNADLIELLKSYKGGWKTYKRSSVRKVFLGGTCNNSTWREVLIPQLDSSKISYFNPVTKNLNPEFQQKEIKQKKKCDFLLCTVTKEMRGIYAIVEVVEDSNKSPEKTIFCYLEEGFDEDQIKSLQYTARLVRDNGAQAFTSLEEVAEYLNSEKLETQIEIPPK